MLIYLHGFNSSSQSYKARLVGRAMADRGRAHEYRCPDLPHDPGEAFKFLDGELTALAGTPVVLIGSSLGGFYATWLAERHGCNAALVNPAVRPYELLSGYLGPQRNLYNGTTYELTRAHIDALRAHEVEVITPSRYFLITCTGDEVLDYRAGVDRYRGARQIVVEGSDHGFSDFAGYVDTVIAYHDEVAAAGSPARL